MNVRQVFENHTNAIQEGTWRFRLPDSGAVGDFVGDPQLVQVALQAPVVLDQVDERVGFVAEQFQDKLTFPAGDDLSADEFVANMVRENVGNEGRKYFPFVFSLFMFILFCNLLGLIPYSFTVTSHIIVTFALAAVVFLGVGVWWTIRAFLL